MMKMRCGVSPGSGGLRAEFLKVLAEKFEDSKMKLLEDFGKRYVNGALPPWYYKVVETVMTVPTFKSSERDAVRPIGIKNQLIRLFHQVVVRQNRREFIKYLEPQQLAMSEAFGGKLINSVRMLSEERRDFVVVKIDMKKHSMNCPGQL